MCFWKRNRSRGEVKPIKRESVQTEDPSRPDSEGNLPVVGNSVAGL